MDTLVGIVFIVYIIAGWWAINKVWYSKHTYIINNTTSFYIAKLMAAVFLGWIAIPIAVITHFLGK